MQLFRPFSGLQRSIFHDCVKPYAALMEVVVMHSDVVLYPNPSFFRLCMCHPSKDTVCPASNQCGHGFVCVALFVPICAQR
mmetsp:Transcript_86077/g.143272  ORF Transcript_86077/g.143272 Transcript_86077/m.143272 type:complete len:81 (-) Transcript_86077:199-441(-)